MTDLDLIRRVDAAQIMAKVAAGLMRVRDAQSAIAALPPVTVGVKPLVWECTDWSAGDGVQGENDCEWQAHVSDWRYMIEWLGRDEFRVTMPDDTDTSAQSLDAAKAAAQADYEARILAALAPAEAGGVEGRPDAPCHIVEYTNWRGETARRAIIPIRMWWGKTEWHPQEQWMLTAWDVEKEATRDFAWQDMKPVQNGATSAALAALAPAEAGGGEEPISDARLECEVLCARFQAGEASEKEVVDTIRYIARANERLAVRLGEAKAAARYSVSAEWVERMLPADEGVTPAAGGSNDEAAMHIETALAMARVQDGYASKATGEGEKLIFKANAKAQRQIADYIRRMSAPAEAGGVPAWLSNCVMCGRIVDTREKEEGGDGHGCEYPEGWTCSSECAEKLHPDPDWMAAEAGGVEAHCWPCHYAGSCADHPATTPAPVDALVKAAGDLKEIVEGIKGAMEHGAWRSENGIRLKDTPEWVAFYNALALIPKDGEKP